MARQEIRIESIHIILPNCHRLETNIYNKGIDARLEWGISGSGGRQAGRQAGTKKGGESMVNFRPPKEPTSR